MAVIDGGLQSIGRVATRVGLSLRTIRYYEEVGLVTPTGRSGGGFRLYSAEDEARLLLIKRMKPLGYPLESMAEMLHLIDTLRDPVDDGAAEAARARLVGLADEVADRVEELRTKLGYAEELRDRLRTQLMDLDVVAVPAQANTK